MGNPLVRSKRASSRRSQSGAAMVECVFAIIVLCTLAFGIVEVGAMYKESTSMYNLARSYARDIAIGKTIAATNTKVLGAANATGELGGSLTSSVITVQYTNVSDGSSGWTNAADLGASTTIPQGDLFKVDLTYTHNRLTNILWNSNKTMDAVVIMRRL